ncbi:hypothetical protein [Jiella pelagia]|uniref:PilZ domain-containing protein n=1 Tax=Jiella pelagia TaxID=2986949 RepID=A0ABY7BYC8_9HYPH|nr:hypothetical protein [Jiella pelagia]WAP67528.1 hypothetical protein OH818_18710 [Jiella pelagia]
MQRFSDGHSGKDGRLFERRRTRLRPVKLASLSRRFLDDGMIYDRSSGGARIRRGSDRPLPPRLLVLDEVEMRLSPVAIVWQAGREPRRAFCRRRHPSDARRYPPAHRALLRAAGVSMSPKRTPSPAHARKTEPVSADARRYRDGHTGQRARHP